MNNKYSAFEILKNNNNKIRAQKIVLEKSWKELKEIYNSMPDYYDYYLNLAANEIFGISNFESLLIVNNYKIIWNYFNIDNIANYDIVLGSLEFFCNVFCIVRLLSWKDFQNKYYKWESDRKSDYLTNFKVFQNFIDETKKFFNWSGYQLIESDNKENQNSKYKIYFLVKKDMLKIIEIAQITKDLKTYLLELTKENLEIKELENYLSIIYNNYLDNEREQIKQTLGNKLCNDIFKLFNNGLVKHKSSENITILSQFNETEKINALKWLKDIILIYFAVSRNSHDYPEKIINFKAEKSNAN